MLAQQALPLELRWVFLEFRLFFKLRLIPRPWNGIELPLMPRVEQQFVDVVFLVGGYEYFCHKPIFSTRSEYFRALLADHFDECQMDGQYDLPIIQINQVSPKGSRELYLIAGEILIICLLSVFSCVVTFVYTNTCEVTEEVVAELLHTADMFLLPGLTKLAGKLLARLVSPDTVIDILRTARLFNLARLEDQVGFCSFPLRKVTINPYFSALSSWRTTSRRWRTARSCTR